MSTKDDATSVDEIAAEAAAVEQKPTVDEVGESLSGFDEIAIENMWRKPLEELGSFMTIRAMAFTLHRRAGMSDKEAFKSVMDARFKSVMDMFAENPKKADGDSDGDEAEGKGD